jgi:hypothetical protein
MIKALEFTNKFKVQWGLRISEPLKDFFDELVDIARDSGV